MSIIKKINHSLIFYILLISLNNTCFSNAVSEDITIDSLLKEKILHSTLKMDLKTKEGKTFVAYLYADDEKVELIDDYVTRDAKTRSYSSRTGHYYLYLYNPETNSFQSKRTKIFKVYGTTRFDIEGAEIFVLPTHKEKKSDILFLSQFVKSEGDEFEAYGFSDDNTYLEKYYFQINSKKRGSFYGGLSPSDINSGLYGYTLHYGEFGPNDNGYISEFHLTLGNDKIIEAKSINNARDN